VQKYIGNPLLIEGAKSNFRVYLLVANMDPLIILVRPGIINISTEAYDKDSTEFVQHVTNSNAAI
jgi:hypothetical protein